MATVTQPVYGLSKSDPRDSAQRDRFLGSALKPWWTNPGIAGQSNVLTFYGPGMDLNGNGAAKHAYNIRMPAPGGSFTAMAKLADIGPNSSDSRSGMYVGANGGVGHVCGPLNQSNAPGYIDVGTISDTADWSSYGGNIVTVAGAITTPRWYRLVWNAGTLTLTYDCSLDAVTWTNIGSRAAIQPTEMGITLYSNSGAITAAYLRCYEWRHFTP